jgi:MFS transporter, DHA2 family, multidrug resistance protein
MRNLGRAIGLALIDTVLYGRAPMHAEALLMRLQTGDAGAAIAAGLPPELVAAQAGRALDAMALAIIRPLVEKAAFVVAVNESWGLLAALIVLDLVSLPFLRVEHGH